MNPIPQNALQTIAIARGVSKLELEALSLALEEHSTDEIAKILGVSPIAIRKRLGEVYRKFEIPGRSPGKLAELKQQLVAEYRSQQPLVPCHRDWGNAPDVSVFYGRTEELATLKQWIVGDNCRLVVLLGMGGIGKTTLLAQLTQQIQEEFDCVVWRSLGNAPPLEDFLADAIDSLSASPASVPETLDERISQLLDNLTDRRCLLVFDDGETLLRSGDRFGRYREGYEEYETLIRRIAEIPHQSCVLFGSCEKPRDIASMEGVTRPVRSFLLEGLDEAAAGEILQEKGLTGKNHWANLIQSARGNPLALNIVATTILDLFHGDVTEFIQHQTWFFGDLRNVLDRQYNRLSELERSIACGLAAESDAVSLLKLKQIVPNSKATSELMEGLASLKQRSWLETIRSADKETPETLYALQNLVKKYLKKYKLSDEQK